VKKSILAVVSLGLILSFSSPMSSFAKKAEKPQTSELKEGRLFGEATSKLAKLQDIVITNDTELQQAESKLNEVYKYLEALLGTKHYPILEKKIAKVQRILDEYKEQNSGAFVDDPALKGSWVAIDFVQNIEDFVAGEQQWQWGLYLQEMNFLDNGVVENAPWWTWTKGLISHSGDQTEARYEIRNINGEDYLFFEWINGDVIYGGAQPHYYVFKRGEYIPTVPETTVEKSFQIQLNSTQMIENMLEVKIYETIIDGQTVYMSDFINVTNRNFKTVTLKYYNETGDMIENQSGPTWFANGGRCDARLSQFPTRIEVEFVDGLTMYKYVFNYSR
jgi:hypothetical protein